METCSDVLASARDYGVVMLGDDPESGEDVALKMVKEGMAKVRDNCQDDALKQAEITAKEEKKGIWAEDKEGKIRSITWEVENPR